jgi:hypothetical protein
MPQDLVDEAFARARASWRSVSRHPAPAACGLCVAAGGEAAPAITAGWARPGHLETEDLLQQKNE